MDIGRQELFGKNHRKEEKWNSVYPSGRKGSELSARKTGKRRIPHKPSRKTSLKVSKDVNKLNFALLYQGGSLIPRKIREA